MSNKLNKQLSELYNFDISDAKEIEEAFPERERGSFTWEKLYEILKIAEETGINLDSPVIVVDKFSGEATKGIDVGLLEEVPEALLNQARKLISVTSETMAIFI